jgi:predicted DNA-binding WGR domain protein
MLKSIVRKTSLAWESVLCSTLFLHASKAANNQPAKPSVDTHCTITDPCHVLEEDNEVFHAMLNQTHVGANANKFYLMQLLEADKGGVYWLWSRWGRVGVKRGQHFVETGGKDELKEKFNRKFQEKVWSCQIVFLFLLLSTNVSSYCVADIQLMERSAQRESTRWQVCIH